MADDDWWRTPLVWIEKEDGSFETDIPHNPGQLRVRLTGIPLTGPLTGNRYFEIEATVGTYSKSRDYDEVKEFIQVFIDNHPKAAEALTTFWEEADLFAQNYIVGRKPRH